MKEIFLDIRQDPNYQISNLGRVKRKAHIAFGPKGHHRFWKEKFMAKRVGTDRYIYTDLKGIGYSVHRLIAIAFIPNPENKPEVNHKNGVYNDYRLDNLEWVTKAENQIHSWRELNRKATWQGKNGFLHPNSKVVNQYDCDGNLITVHGSIAEAARNFNCSDAAIRKAIILKSGYWRGQTWTYGC